MALIHFRFFIKTWKVSGLISAELRICKYFSVPPISLDNDNRPSSLKFGKLLMKSFSIDLHFDKFLTMFSLQIFSFLEPLISKHFKFLKLPKKSQSCRSVASMVRLTQFSKSFKNSTVNISFIPSLKKFKSVIEFHTRPLLKRQFMELQTLDTEWYNSGIGMYVNILHIISGGKWHKYAYPVKENSKHIKLLHPT